MTADKIIHFLLYTWGGGYILGFGVSMGIAHVLHKKFKIFD
jgi:hypothetical protein